jgi:hypothetical protein
VSIGSGYTTDVNKAHLYTTKKLADDKIEKEIEWNPPFNRRFEFRCKQLNVVKSQETDWVNYPEENCND